MPDEYLPAWKRDGLGLRGSNPERQPSGFPTERDHREPFYPGNESPEPEPTLYQPGDEGTTPTTEPLRPFPVAAPFWNADGKGLRGNNRDTPLPSYPVARGVPEPMYKRRSPDPEIPEENDDDDDAPPLSFCDALDDNLFVTISGLAACGCVFSFTPPQSTNYSALTGVNGGHSFSRVTGQPFWRRDLGSLAAQGFAGVTCETDPGDEYEIVLTGFVTCDPVTELLRVRVLGRISTDGRPETPDEATTSILDVVVALGVTTDNTAACDETDSVPDSPGVAGGQVLVEA